MHAPRLLLAALALSLLSPAVLPKRPAISALGPGARRGVLPMQFEQNAGQVDRRVRFLGRSGGATVFLTDEGATLSLGAPAAATPSDRPDAVIRIRISGGRIVPPRPERKSATVSNYFLGNDPSKWRTGIPHFGRVVYPDVLDGVDLVYHGEDGRLEYDFLVAPGVAPGAIVLDIGGEAEANLTLTDTGDLAIRTEHGVLIQRRPRAYQLGAHGETSDVGAEYRLTGERSVGFVVAAYDKGRPLVIDPVLEYSTYLGGSGGDHALALAVDAAGSAYVTGSTSSADFPTARPLQATKKGYRDAFVAKLSPAGDALVYSTFLGGTDVDGAWGIAVDAAGSAYVTGVTTSLDFPTRHPIQPARAGDTDAFVLKLSPAGDALEYSTYLGGTTSDHGTAIAVDASGSAYVAGGTQSTDFLTQNPLQPVGGDSEDVFVAKLSPAGDALLYSTYFGGTNSDVVRGIAVDSAGSAYLAGSTSSTDLPIRAPFQGTNASDSSQREYADAFVSKLSPSGDSLVYSTYLGGSAEDSAAGIVVDTTGSAYVVGSTSSANFPVRHALQAAYAGRQDVFVTKLSPAGDSLVYSTYLGGSDGDWGTSVAIDGAGQAYLQGGSISSDFPTREVIEPFAGGAGGGFLAALSPDGGALVHSALLGPGTSQSFGIAVQGRGTVYLAGHTQSTTFPTRRPVQAAFAGDSDAFVLKLEMALSTVPDAGTEPPRRVDPPAADTQVAEVDAPNGRGCGVAEGPVSNGANGLVLLALLAGVAGRGSLLSSGARRRTRARRRGPVLGGP